MPNPTNAEIARRQRYKGDDGYIHDPQRPCKYCREPKALRGTISENLAVWQCIPCGDIEYEQRMIPERFTTNTTTPERGGKGE